MSPKQHTRTAPRRALRLAALALFCVATPGWARAQGTTAYVYDDNGRLHAVVSPTGEAAVYEYDAVGNFTAIRRLKADDLELLSFSPREGVPGDLVTFVGVGFGAGVNAVLFNGTAARVVSVSVPKVVAEVPQGATSGPVTLVTPRGSVTTPSPFTIRGLHVSPAAAKIISGESIPFTATVVLGGNQSVRWSVNGAEGGDAGVGTISPGGLYTAPPLPRSQPSALVFVRAMSEAAPELFGEAEVTVLNPDFIRTARSPAVSVRVVNTPAVSPFSREVSVRLGNAQTVSPRGAAVSLTTAPSVSAISPGQISRGATVTVTLGGANLRGATDIKFVGANGAVDSNVVASGLSFSAAGTSMTATLKVNAGAAPGPHVVVIIAAGGRSQSVDTGTNVVLIQ